MTVLGIDTATAVATVGVFRGRKIAAERWEVAPGAHARCLADLTDSVLEDAGVTLSDIDGIAVSLGPGSFTGLRIGISFAKGIAYAGKRPLVGIPTLEALAVAAEPTGAPWIAACLDARKGEVYLAVYRRTPRGLETLVSERAVSPETAAREIRDQGGEAGGVVVGDAAEAHAEIFEPLVENGARVLSFQEIHPRGGLVAALGESRLGSGAATTPESLVPRYVRASEAEIRAAGLR